jgi:hypothetical protein
MRKSATKSRHAQTLLDELEDFVQELLVELDGRLDKRLVRTFLLTLQAIVTFRHSSGGLLLSELGGYITGPEQAPAGTQRLSNLLRSKRWGYRIIERFLWRRADQRVTELLREDETALVVWDESVWEKPESLHSDGLSPVRSSKAQRLKIMSSILCKWRFQDVDIGSIDHMLKLFAIFLVIVPNQKARSFTKRRRFAQLLCHPGVGGMACHIDMHHSP